MNGLCSVPWSNETEQDLTAQRRSEVKEVSLELAEILGQDLGLP